MRDIISLGGLQEPLRASAASSAMSRCWAPSATAAITRAPPKAHRTPATSPKASMQSPPTTGPRAMGIRRKSECMETPMVRLFEGSTLATRLMVAGSDRDVQERKSTDPRITACHDGTRITTRNPPMAKRLKTTRAFFVPSRSEMYPPGKE
ncbi:MAG: hypothetical protein BWY88_01303 [Synergistetes bacterium ADurb.Bin520]|nr:MAG: hypothetical protein BWY88_01303 [Synergistetes bacterium ADurb.Bin520]